MNRPIMQQLNQAKTLMLLNKYRRNIGQIQNRDNIQTHLINKHNLFFHQEDLILLVILKQSTKDKLHNMFNSLKY